MIVLHGPYTVFFLSKHWEKFEKMIVFLVLLLAGIEASPNLKSDDFADNNSSKPNNLNWKWNNNYKNIGKIRENGSEKISVPFVKIGTIYDKTILAHLIMEIDIEEIVKKAQKAEKLLKIFEKYHPKAVANSYFNSVQTKQIKLKSALTEFILGLTEMKHSETLKYPIIRLKREENLSKKNINDSAIFHSEQEIISSQNCNLVSVISKMNTNIMKNYNLTLEKIKKDQYFEKMTEISEILSDFIREIKYLQSEKNTNGFG